MKDQVHLHNPAKRFSKNARGRMKVTTVNEQESKTQQHHKDACDINNIIRKYKQTGELTHLARQQGVYADISSVGSYQDSMDQVLKVQDAFMTLSAKTRLRFGNNPQELIEFLKDPNNREEAAYLGLIEKPKPSTSDEPQQTQRDSNATKKTKTSDKSDHQPSRAPTKQPSTPAEPE